MYIYLAYKPSVNRLHIYSRGISRESQKFNIHAKKVQKVKKPVVVSLMNVHDAVRTKSKNVNQSYPQYTGAEYFPLDAASRDTRDQTGTQ